MAESLTATEIIEKANEPASVTVDGQRVDTRSIDDVIKADQYAATKAATAKKKLGIRFFQCSMPGSV